MKCHNFLCDMHSIKKGGNNCKALEWATKPQKFTNAYIGEYVGKNIKNCETRKRYNRINKAGTWEGYYLRVGKRFYQERDKYHGRDK